MKNVMLLILILLLAAPAWAGTIELSFMFTQGSTPDKVTIDRTYSPSDPSVKHLDFDADGSYANPVFAARSAIVAGQEQGTVASDGDLVTGTVFPSTSNKIDIDVTASSALFTKGEYVLTVYDSSMDAIGATQFCVDGNANKVSCTQRVRQY